MRFRNQQRMFRILNVARSTIAPICMHVSRAPKAQNPASRNAGVERPSGAHGRPGKTQPRRGLAIQEKHVAVSLQAEGALRVPHAPLQLRGALREGLVRPDEGLVALPLRRGSPLSLQEELLAVSHPGIHILRYNQIRQEIFLASLDFFWNS